MALGRLVQKVKSAAAMILQPRELLSKKWNGLDFGQVSGRALVLKRAKAWQGLRSVIEDKA